MAVISGWSSLSGSMRPRDISFVLLDEDGSSATRDRVMVEFEVSLYCFDDDN